MKKILSFQIAGAVDTLYCMIACLKNTHIKLLKEPNQEEFCHF
jgi:hypothetical protein